MITFLAIVILSLAAFRVTKLVIDDTIVDPIREKTVWKLDPKSKLRELLECPWCLGFWISLVAVLFFLTFPVVTLWVALPFAISAAVGLLAEAAG